MWYDETHLQWTPPSPNMKTLTTATLYPGTCLFEGTNVSEGRGTLKPFEYIGAPWIDGKKISEHMNGLRLPGVRFHPIVFTPRADAIAAPNPKFLDEMCGGIVLQVTDRKTFQPVSTAMQIVSAIISVYPNQFKFLPSTFDKLIGVRDVRSKVENGENISTMERAWRKDSARFQDFRKKYLLY